MPSSPDQLLNKAKAVLEALRLGARRAFVVELTGTPKAGKTTTLAVLQGFFKTAGFRVETLKERAADCPLAMKGHFFFNAWTFGTMLAEVLANIERPVDLLILDRGFFDALIWLELQRSRHQVTDEEVRVFTDFVTLSRWQRLVDYTVVMTAAPEVALQRENHNQLIPRQGSLMNPDALKSFNESVERARSKHKDIFNPYFIDTTDSSDAKASALLLLDNLLEVMGQWANSAILVVDKSAVTEIFAGRAYIDALEAPSVLVRLLSVSRSMPRVEAEKNADLVQLVVGGVPVRSDGKLLVFRRETSDEKATSYGETTLWKGRHVPGVSSPSLDGTITALKSRLSEELHIETEMEPRLACLAWWRPNQHPDEFTDPQHLGILFRVQLPDAVADTLHKKEFRKGSRGYQFTGGFRTQEDLLPELETMRMEPWSRHLVETWRIDA